jgi:O-antigen/teichoic acid export membrane protein
MPLQWPRPLSNVTEAPLSRTHVVLARNAGVNLLGQILVAGTALAVLPKLVRGLGPEAYGIFALSLTVFGSFTFLELGLGRTTTKYVAECLATQDDKRLVQVFWTTLTLQALTGLVVGIGIGLVAPWLSSAVQTATPEGAADVYGTILIVAAAAPAVMVASSLRGALEGAQRFDLVNVVKVALNVSTYVLPFVLVQFGLRVPAIVLWLLVARVTAACAYLGSCLIAIPAFRRRRPAFADARTLRVLFSFSGWTALYNFTVPVLGYAGPYVIAAILGAGMVTYYAVPTELLGGLWIIPSSLVATLFPAFSGASATGGRGVGELFWRSVKYNTLLLLPAAAALAAFSGDFLLWWQGPELASRSTMVLQILAFVVLVNSSGWIPANLLIATNHVGVVTLLALAQIPVYLGLSVYLTSQWGVVGSATAFLLRCAVETALLFGAAAILVPHSRLSNASPRSWLFAGTSAVTGGLLVGTLALSLPLQARLGLAAAILVLHAWSTWHLALDDVDRRLVRAAVPLRRAAGQSAGEGGSPEA